MNITTEQLQQHLSRTIAPLYTVYGDEPLLVLEACDRIRAAARSQGYIEREVLTVDANFKWSELAMAGSAQSLFASRKLLELRIPNGKPGVEGSSALQAYCKRVPEDTITLVQLPELDWRSQKSGWFESLASVGVTVEARAITRKALPQWLAGRLQAQQQNADADTLSFIADRVEGNLMAAHQEVQKLALLFPPGKIDYPQVREAVLDVARYDVFDLGVVMLEGDAARLARTLDGLKGEGVAPPLVLWALTEEICALAHITAGLATGKPVAALIREARIRGAAHQSLMQAHAARFTVDQVNQAMRHAAAVDRMIKGLTRGDVWDELLQLGLRFRGSSKTLSDVRATSF
jgi:DNA polymerase III subunit delta